MDLKDWLRIKKMKVTEFQRLSGLTRPTIYKAIEGWENINVESAEAIRIATGGEVLIKNVRGCDRSSNS